MTFPRYSAYKDSGLDWLGKVPDHWKVTALKRGFDVTLGKMLQTESSGPGDELRPYLRAANIKWNGIDSTEIKQMWLSVRDRSQLKLDYGDLLISEGGDVGRSCLWKSEIEECYFQNSVNRVRARHDNSNRYLYYWMSTIKSMGYIDVLCNKSTIAHFTAEKVAAVPIPLPPRNEQDQIATFLDHETAKIDALVIEQRRLIELLKEKRQAIISRTITRGLNPNVRMKPSGIEWLGNVPAHWQIKPVKYLLETLTDFTANGSFASLAENVNYLNSGYSRLVRLTDLREALSNDGLYVDEAAHRYLSKSELFGGEVLLANVGAYAGYACLMPKVNHKSTLGPNMYLIRFNPLLLTNDYGLLCLMSINVQEQLRLASTSTAQPKLNKANVKNCVVALPSCLEEQDEILKYLAASNREFSNLIAEAKLAIDLLQERRTALIAAAVAGQIDVREQPSFA